MPFNNGQTAFDCPICTSPANVRDMGGRSVAANNLMGDALVDCVQCGDFRATHTLVEDWPAYARGDSTKRALASHVIRLLGKRDRRPLVHLDLLQSLLEYRAPPSPAEASNSLVLLIGDALKTRPGEWYQEYWRGVTAQIGLVAVVDAIWLTKGVVSNKLIEMSSPTFDTNAGSPLDGWVGRLTFAGWEKYGELMRARDVSNVAFLARRFANEDLDSVYTNCLRPAVRKTGFDLRIVPARAGLIDAIIESDIRGCRFLVADLSDDNAGSYWEAGFAEGLGKPVVYICKQLDDEGRPKHTHFDTAHRTTIRWSRDPATFQRTEDELRAVIRNTLLGEASQTDIA